jgi:hypothetical protein
MEKEMRGKDIMISTVLYTLTGVDLREGVLNVL